MEKFLPINVTKTLHCFANDTAVQADSYKEDDRLQASLSHQSDLLR